MYICMCTLSCEKGLIDSYLACSPMTYHSVSKRGRLGWTVARGDCALNVDISR